MINKVKCNHQKVGDPFWRTQSLFWRTQLQCNFAYIINNKLHFLAHLKKKNNTLGVEVSDSVGTTKDFGKNVSCIYGSHTYIKHESC